MGKKLKIAVVVVVVIVGLIIVGALVSIPYVNTDVESIAGVTQFVAIKDGSLYKMRFSLIDNNNVASASDADVAYGIMDKDHRQLLYNDTFQIKASDFQQYQLVLTGAPIHAYAWQVETQDLPLSPGELYEVLLVVVLPNGKTFRATTSLLG